MDELNVRLGADLLCGGGGDGRVSCTRSDSHNDALAAACVFSIHN